MVANSRLDCDPARDLARRVTAHAVGDDEEAELEIGAESSLFARSSPVSETSA
jgi:hypothetical protein